MDHTKTTKTLGEKIEENDSRGSQGKRPTKREKTMRFSFSLLTTKIVWIGNNLNTWVFLLLSLSIIHSSGFEERVSSSPSAPPPFYSQGRTQWNTCIEEKEILDRLSNLRIEEVLPSSLSSAHSENLFFLDATTHHYKRSCPSVRPSVGPSVRRSVGPALFSNIEKRYF